MLAYILAIVVGLSSLFLLATAFTDKNIHRKDDFLWSAVGLFYALILWVCARRITGAVLLGQTAAAILILSFGWQALKLREAILYPDKQQAVLNFSVVNWFQNRLGKASRPKVKQPIPSVSQTPQPVETETPLEEAKTVIQETAEAVQEPFFVEDEVEEPYFSEAETTEPSVSQPPISKSTEQVPYPSQTKKGFSFKNLFGLRQKKPKTSKTPSTVTPVPESPAAELENFVPETEIKEIVDEDITEASAITPPETSFTEEMFPLDFESEQEDFESFFVDSQSETIIDIPPANVTPPFVDEAIEPQTTETIFYEEVTQVIETSTNEVVTETFTLIVETSEEETSSEDTVNELQLREKQENEESELREEQNEKPFDF